MHQQIDDGRHADGEGNGHARGQQAEEDHQDEEDFEARRSRGELPDVVDDRLAEHDQQHDGARRSWRSRGSTSGVPSAVLAIASRR